MEMSPRAGCSSVDLSFLVEFCLQTWGATGKLISVPIKAKPEIIFHGSPLKNALLVLFVVVLKAHFALEHYPFLRTLPVRNSHPLKSEELQMALKTNA